MDQRIVVLCVVVLAIFCASDATLVVEKLKTRVRAPIGSAAMPASNSMASISSGSAGAPSSVAPVASVSSEGGSVESIAATKLIGEGSCAESSSSCSGGAIRWGDVGSSSSSNSAGSDDLPPVDDVVGPIANWIKAFKKRIGNSGNIADAAHAIVQPLIEKLKRNQKMAEDKLEESNQAILDTVEKSVTAHVLKLLKAEKITEAKAEQSEALQAKVEARRDEQSEREIRGESSAAAVLSAAISQSVAELSQNPGSKSVLEHVSQELEKAKRS